jgi:hypothetical protein
VVAPLAILGAKLLWDAVNKLKAPQWACVLAVIIIAIPSCWLSMHYAYSKTLPQTRIIAKEWIEANIPEGSQVLVDFYGPVLERYEHRFIWLSKHKPQLIPLFEKYFGTSEQTRYRLEHIKPVLDIRQGSIEDSVVPSVQERVEAGAEYIVTSSFFKAFFYHPNVKRFYPNYTAKWRDFYQELEETGERIYQTGPSKWRIAGPEITVYSLSEPDMEDL